MKNIFKTKHIFYALIIFLILTANCYAEKVYRSYYTSSGPIDIMIENAYTVVEGVIEEVLPGKWFQYQIVVGEEEAAKMPKDSLYVMVPSEEAATEFRKRNKDIGQLYTDKILKVNRYLKNDLKEEKIVIREPGGSAEGRQITIQDDTPLKLGEKVILLLEKCPNNIYTVMGGPSGKLYIEGGTCKDGVGKNYLVTDIE